MALNPATLTEEIIDTFDAERISLGFDALSTFQKDGMRPLIESIATAVIEHVVANGVVTIQIGGVTVDPTTHANLVPITGGIT